MPSAPLIFERSTEIDAPAEFAFQWHARPGAFQRLTPPWEPVTLVEETGTIEDGDRKVIRLKLGPFKKDWVAVHQNYDPPRSFEDKQVSGPFADWVHTHAFEPLGEDRCRLTDHIEYRLPLGFLGRLLGRRFSEKKLDRMFRFRHDVTRRDIARLYRASLRTPEATPV